MKKIKLKEITGVIPALLTPFDEKENFSPKKMEGLVKHLMGYDIGGLYLTGSTGEGFMMTNPERMEAVEVVLDQTKGKVPVIVHVGAISTKQSEELARHAQQSGADAISSVPPIYWKFSDEAIAGYYRDLVQASGLPMVVYNVALAGLVSFDMILKLGKIEGVQGIKYTASSHYDLFRIKEALGQDFMVYSGSDEMAASGLTFGADGLIGSTYNLLSDIFIRILKAEKESNIPLLRTLQQGANDVIFTLLQYDLIPALKLGLKWMGVDAGISRRPFTQYTAREEQAIQQALAPLQSKLKNLHIDFLKKASL